MCNAIICNDDIFDDRICDAVVIGNPVQLNMEQVLFAKEDDDDDDLHYDDYDDND